MSLAYLAIVVGATGIQIGLLVLVVSSARRLLLRLRLRQLQFDLLNRARADGRYEDPAVCYVVEGIDALYEMTPIWSRSFVREVSQAKPEKLPKPVLKYGPAREAHNKGAELVATHINWGPMTSLMRMLRPLENASDAWRLKHDRAIKQSADKIKKLPASLRKAAANTEVSAALQPAH